MLLYPIGSTSACRHAAALLQAGGIAITDHPSPEVTHLLLDIPSFSTEGCLRNGETLSPVLQMLPSQIVVVGGKLSDSCLGNYTTMDLLQNPLYLAKNAAITAQCALKLALPTVDTNFCETPALVIGWGRIGTCLAQMLKALDFPVTVAARSPAHRAMLEALGFRAVEIPQIPDLLPQMGLVFNTVPVPLLTCLPSPCCPVFDLASAPGLDGLDVVTARGLPGTMAAKASGALIAETILASLPHAHSSR